MNLTFAEPKMGDKGLLLRAGNRATSLSRGREGSTSGQEDHCQ